MPLLLALLLAAAPDKPAAVSAKDPGLVDATTVVPGLALDIRYATTNNFLKTKLYDAARCLLRKPVAERLAKAQAALEKKGFRLKAHDCYRPFSVQKAMWKAFPVRGFVAPPVAGGSNHNRGAAVDVTLVTLDGKDVEMPTEYDSFSKQAYALAPDVPEPAKTNRAILRKAMLGAGFKPVRMEWWHFDDPDALSFGSLDVPLAP